MEPQIRLRWTSHQGTIMSVFDALLTSESLVDVTLACEGQCIRAHKLVLSACSPYFQALLNIDANKHPILFLKDVKYAELKALIQYMYRGEVSIAQEDLPSLLAVAQALMIRGLADVETETNSISSDTIILPEHGSKNRVMMPTTPSPPPLAAHAPPPPVLVPSPMVSPSVQVPRTAQHLQYHNISASSNPILGEEPVSVSAPPAKKSRMEGRQPIQISAATKVQKQSQLVDPLLDVDSSDINTAVSSFADPLANVSEPSTFTHKYPEPVHLGHSQDRDFGDREILEYTEPYGTQVIKLEANGPIEIDLEEVESPLSQSSFSESWQMGDGDNSELPDDDGELPGGSGNNDGAGAEGGEDYYKSKIIPKPHLEQFSKPHQKALPKPPRKSLPKRNKWKCNACAKNFIRGFELLRHCKTIHNKSVFKCNRCDFRCNRKDSLLRHGRRMHAMN